MRLTIIPSDGTVCKDNVCFTKLTLEGIPDNIHALQWYDSYGEVEFSSVFDGTKITKQQNEIIKTLPDWVNGCVSVHAAEFQIWQVEQEKIAALVSHQPISTGTQAA